MERGRPVNLDIEPIVRVNEDTSLDPCVEQLAGRLNQGMSYRQFLSALFLSGLWNGTELRYYHCIYMLHSAQNRTDFDQLENHLACN